MKMMQLLAATILSAAVLGGPVPAQTADAPERLDELGREVARVSRSLEQVSKSLDALVRLQKTNLLLQRLVIEERRISPLAGELRSEKASARNQQEELARIRAYKEELESRISEAIRSGVEPHVDDREQQRGIDREITLQTENLEANFRRIQELENDLARARRALEVLEESVAEALEELDRQP